LQRFSHEVSQNLSRCLVLSVMLTPLCPLLVCVPCSVPVDSNCAGKSWSFALSCRYLCLLFWVVAGDIPKCLLEHVMKCDGVVHQGEGRRTLRCTDIKGRHVAVCISSSLAGALHVSCAFRALSDLQQEQVPCVPRIAFFVDQEFPILATHWIDGVSLWKLVVSGGPVNVSTALQWYDCLKGALADIHKRGLVHNDVTPPNIIVGGQGGHLIDFGIASKSVNVRSNACNRLFRKRRRDSMVAGVNNDTEMLQMALSFAVLGLAEYTRQHKMGTLPLKLFQ
jgi:serine/threonine protein kinase